MSRRAPPQIEGLYSVKIDNISYNTTQADLRRLFEKYGEIGDIHIPRDKYTRTSKGFGFVRYYSRRDAEYAQDRVDGRWVDGRELRVAIARYERPIDERGGGGGGRGRSRSPPPRRRSRSRSPRYSRSRSRSARRSKDRSGSPRRRSPSRERSHSRSRSGSAKRSASPRKRSASPRKRSASPRKRSASPRKSRSRSASKGRSRSRSGSPHSGKDMKPNN